MENLEEKLDVSGKNVYTEDQIRELLSRMPATIYKYATELSEAQTELDKVEHNLRVVKAKCHLYASANKEVLQLSSVDDRKSWVIQQDEVRSAEDEVIAASAKVKIANIKYERAEHEFIAVRKLASLLESEKSAQMNYDRYNSRNYVE
jgi:hypothetical protein|nr:MAG TPA: hypothetical protein [Caudoviricetes sp.]